MPEADFDQDAWRDRLVEFRQDKGSFVLDSPESPLVDADLEFDALDWYPLDPEYRVIARFQPVNSPEEVTLPSTTGPDRTYERAATFGFTLGGEHHVLTGYRHEGQESLFVPFTDETNGDTTSEYGRYLDVDPADADVGDDVVLEFNLAHLPFAAYSATYASTVPPTANHLTVAVQAGERLP